MTISLYNTASRTTEELRPVHDGQVGIYVCGATVQGQPHIGHLRSASVFDTLRRWLLYSGYRVTMIRNVTDIDDKILTKSVEEGREWFAHAYKYERAFTAAYEALDVLPPSSEPRATGHITEMIELISRLIEAGHAYPALDGSADVYFDAASWADYGQLTNQRLEDMELSEGAELRGKKDARDFALWKAHKPEEPITASWPSPWGRGRPGWHIECSAMSTKYLGANFDIHGGGLDLRFPHHENELAQSRAAGDAFANIWMHSGLLNVGGDKMSKSLGNSVFASDLFARFSPLAVRYFLTGAGYRSTLDFSDEAMERSESSLERLTNFLQRARQSLGDNAPALPDVRDGYAGRSLDVPVEFAAALDDDLGVPRALSVVFASVTEGAKLLDSGTDSQQLARIVAEVELMLDILGVNPSAEAWAVTASDAKAESALEALIATMAERRAEAKAVKDFATADSIRDELAAAGVVIEDTADGYRYHLGEG
ncbi:MULTISPECIES: cysteine--tRNA ligase [unclassified Brevibacterium]|uniref:cysteine--tRNA ligase n=1 Tax=unclassified Brevibacterium TaxID=2614124 RepID=UPI001BA668A4|nr:MULTISPECIES: cysteine--tRNA ligase [unclassified Brevibacterium]QUL79415.1 cysteine--tRNA ligase [Brevibacterium sp. SMBL_HHYL_HB1]HJA61232.1 cysteine--tRNA ligase [Candidatus Brevibacterium intestinavium]